MRSYAARFVRLNVGLFLYALGLVFCIHANIGLAPWDAFAMGVASQTGTTFGIASIWISAVIVLLTLAMKEKIGIGTILNGILIGLWVDLIGGYVPYMQNLLSGVLMLWLGQFTVSFATYFYIVSAMGAGPRDSLMVALCKRFPGKPVGLIRGSIESVVLAAGWAMGAKVGIGTVIAVFGISFIIQFTFKLVRFDVKTVVHESVFETVHHFARLASK
ncbi:MAG: hypothetical protein SOZ52_07975 [Pyramidobacter sp.]|nr:hypothetical protein [Pyramidobacter sp.]